MANKRFTTIKNDYCIAFDGQAGIEEVPEANSRIKSGIVYDFTPLPQLAQFESSQLFMADVIGVVTELQGISQIQIRSTQEMRNK